MSWTTPIAQLTAASSRVLLKHLFRRPAANFPGKIALYIDPLIIESRAKRLKEGSICVVGTDRKSVV